ncbi:TPR domain protein [Raphidiopsis curvata NIES-932]|nr:TPR domain protein [Raphidiopsis curvata NIES-932]
MKKFLTLALILILFLVSSFSLGTSPSYAYSQSDLDRLLETRKCPECDLSYADLKFAHLRSANLRGAKLQGADLSNAKLKNADLTGADLVGTHFRGADLTGADLRCAAGADLIVAEIVAERWKEKERQLLVPSGVKARESSRAIFFEKEREKILGKDCKNAIEEEEYAIEEEE